MTNQYQIEFRSGAITAGVTADFRMMPEVIRPVQTHSCNVAVVEAEGELPDLEDIDAIITFRKGTPIGVRTADCVPILLFAPDIKAIAAVHAGWKGTIGGILSKTIEVLKSRGADMSMVEAAFGPSICGKCYEVSEQLAQQFADAGYASGIISPRHIDLQEVNIRQLTAAGVKEENIERKQYCTYETAWLPSWRREPGENRLITWIRMD